MLETYLIYFVRLVVNVIVILILIGCGVLLTLAFSRSNDVGAAQIHAHIRHDNIVVRQYIHYQICAFVRSKTR